MTETGATDRIRPLLRTDPPSLGDVRLSGRLEVGDGGIVYAGVLADQPVVVAMLTAGAEVDRYARARFRDAVGEARLAGTEATVVAGEDEPQIAPWVAVRAETWDDAAMLAGALLAPVTVSHVGPVGTARGPAFRPHWWSHPGPGRWRVWPLPWPATLSTAGRWTYVASFALVLAISTIALFIAVKLFANQPPAPVNPPYPAPTLPTPSTRSPTPSPPATTQPQRPHQPGGTGNGNPSIA
jgi:hypothetical protein